MMDELIALASAVSLQPGTTLELILAGCINGFNDDEVTLMTDLSLAAYLLRHAGSRSFVTIRS